MFILEKEFDAIKWPVKKLKPGTMFSIHGMSTLRNASEYSRAIA